MIDCDVHNSWTSARVLEPFLDPFSKDYLARGEGGGEQIPTATRPWLHPEGYMRHDAVPAGGGVPGSDYELMCSQLLDAYDIDYAVLTGDEMIDVSTIANARYACALARAHNDWLADSWLARDQRLLGSIFVAPQDPAAAAAEIRRVAATYDRFCQVLLSSGSQKPYGDPFYHPIWDASNEVGIPVAVHLGGSAGVNAAPFASGSPTYFWEHHALLSQAGMTHVASVIAQGIFEKFPNTALVVIELGAAWLPGLLWRLDMDYKALRKETPWLRMLPTEYARGYVRLSTQPLEDPVRRQQLWQVLEAGGAPDVLMYASDYPHWDFDDPRSLGLPKEWADAVFDGNARKLYGLPTSSSHSKPASFSGA